MSTTPKRARIRAASRRKCSTTPAPCLTIVGHSERRDAQRESDVEVKAKAEAALACGLGVILCVGESLDVREAGGAMRLSSRNSMARFRECGESGRAWQIAYEPIWAIGTGKVPTVAEIAEMHRAIRGRLDRRATAPQAGSSHPLWWLGQGLQRGGDFALPTSTARWSAVPA